MEILACFKDDMGVTVFLRKSVSKVETRKMKMRRVFTMSSTEVINCRK